MWLSSWLEALRIRTVSRRSRAGQQQHRRRATRRLFLEGLEDRRVMAFDLAGNYATGDTPLAVVTADFNNDSVLDLAVPNYWSRNVSVLLGNSDGTFQPAIDSSTTVYPVSVAVGDFDGDGVLDIATAEEDTNYGRVSILIGETDASGNGTGHFQERSSANLFSTPTSLAVGDFNGDGLLDVGVTSVNYYGPSESAGGATVLLGNGQGGIAGQNTIGLGSGHYWSATVANFNSDISSTGHEIQDYVTVGFDSQVVSVLLGDSSGTFQSPVEIHAGTSLYAVTAGDVDSDSFIDLVTANYDRGTVGVMLGNGSGNFSDPIEFATGGTPISVVLGDFTQDGNLDIATSTEENQVAVFYGDGNGNFSVPLLSTAGSYPYDIVAGDFNGDTWLDIAAATIGDDGVSILINDQNWPDSPPAPAQLNISNAAAVVEGNLGTVAVLFTVTRSGSDLTGVATVSYSTTNGGALAGSDYVAESGMLTFGPGEVTKIIAILVNGDLTDEYDQSFYVNLTNPSGAVISDELGIATILDDDLAPTITITSLVSGKEGPTNKTTSFVFFVTLSAASEKEVQVSFATANGTATTADNDYVARSGALYFAPGALRQSVSILAKGDKNNESNETFFVNLSGATNATIAAAQGIGEILNDDFPSVKRKR